MRNNRPEFALWPGEVDDEINDRENLFPSFLFDWDEPFANIANCGSRIGNG